MHSVLLRPGSDNSISLWCKLRHTIAISNYWSWFPFLDDCIVWIKFFFYIYIFPPISWPWYRAWPSPIMSGFHGAFATGVACQQGTLNLPDTWFRSPLWDLLVLQLLRPDSMNLPRLYSTFHFEYPLVLSRFCFKPSHNLFINGTIPPLLLLKQGMFCTQVHVYVCISYFHSPKS